MERTNAMHVALPEAVSLVTVDVAWTKQRLILPAARRLLTDDGDVVTLIKPHYEAEPAMLRKGVLPEENLDAVVEKVKYDIGQTGFELRRTVRSPIRGTGGNVELLAWLRPVAT
jgi:23S rRNA (cytidine1920-2'-O)/16S rRNA (cytidine1409-2'-O)-methyltransferase